MTTAPTTALVGIQRRFTEVGRIRTGEKKVNAKGSEYPAKLDTFRLTSGNLDAIKAAADKYGGSITKFEETQYQVITNTATLDVMLPPPSELPMYSLFYELWSGGGCQRRCNGTSAVVAERVKGPKGEDNTQLVERDCLCDPDQRECKPTLRVGFFLPEVTGFGLWRLESKGYNAAAELPGMLNLLAVLSSGDRPVKATLRLEQRTSVRAGKTRHYAVPVLDLPYSLAQLPMYGEGDKVLLPPASGPDAPAQLSSSPSRLVQGEEPVIPVQEPEAPAPAAPPAPVPAATTVVEAQAPSTPAAAGEPTASQEPPEESGPAAVDLDAPLPEAELPRWLAGTHAAMRQRIKPEQDEHTMLHALAVQVAGMKEGGSLNELTARQWHRLAVALRDLPVIEQPAVPVEGPAGGEGAGAVSGESSGSAQALPEAPAPTEQPAAAVAVTGEGAGAEGTGVAAPIEQPQQVTMEPGPQAPEADAPSPAAVDVPATTPSPPGGGGPATESAGPAGGASAGAGDSPDSAAPPYALTDAVLQSRYEWGEAQGFDDEALDAAAIAAVGVSPLEADPATWQAFTVTVEAGAVSPPPPPPPKPGTQEYKDLPTGYARSQARAYWAGQGG